jgi:trimeric autotransporter adhesin
MRSNLSKVSVLALTLFILATLSPNISAQTTANAATSSVPATQNVARITQAVRESDRVTLKGNTHPLASVKNDVGAAPDSLPMERMLLVLKRSADQEASLKTLMESQQSKSSPNFHQWLTPDQFGQQFGVSESDIQAVTAWLQTHGFSVNRVATGKMLIEFSGTAGQVHEAFQTQIHKYVVNGEEHWANASDPTIPSALAAVVSGVNTLHNFSAKPMLSKRGVISRSMKAGSPTPLDDTSCPALGGIVTGTPASSGCFGVGPTDFAAIYNVPSTVGGAPAGTGQTIAVVGDSEICTGTPLPTGCTTDDVLNFRTIFGLPTGGATNTPKIVLDGADPGFNPNGDELEGDLDVEYSGAVAPNAQILFVIAGNTFTSSGVDLAAERIVDLNLAPVLTESFGECELFLGNAGNEFFSGLWAQAAAQGITVIISTGDSGSASCDTGALVSENGLTINGIGSTPFNVAAGGTDFDFQAAGYPGNFWNTTTGPHGLSAKGYIPETTWNESCAVTGITGCNGFLPGSTSPLLEVVGAGGGQSNCEFKDQFGDCFGYAKPVWQSGSGAPADMFRDIPDISLFSSDGALSGSFYLVCAADIGATCATSGSSSNFFAVGGTSAAAPSFAGIMALVNQKMVSSSLSGRQGNANFVLYPMSAAQNESICNSSANPQSTCVFNDVIKGNNSVPCDVIHIGNCISPSNGPIGVLESFTCNAQNQCTVTGQPGFAATSGYDLATGLGSINVTNLVNGWPAASGAFTATTTTLALTPNSTCPGGTPGGTSCVTITHGTQVNVAINVTGGANIVGNALLIGTCLAAHPNCFPGGNNFTSVDHFDSVTLNSDVYPLTNGATTNAFTLELIGGTYNVTAHYAGDGIHGVSDSTSPILVTVNPEGSGTSVKVIRFNPFKSPLSGTVVTTAPYGSALAVRTDIIGSASQTESASGQVTLTDTFPGSTPVVLNLNSDGHAELRTPNISFLGNNLPIVTSPALAVGTHVFTSAFPGDSSYLASTSPASTFTVTQATTATAITNAPTSVSANSNFTLVALVDTAGFGNAPTGSVTFFASGVSIGTAPLVAAQDVSGFTAGQATLTTARISATSSITAQYVVGDVNYTASVVSPAVTVTATTGPTFTLASASNPTVVAGSSGTSVITVAPTNSFTGTVALTCSVAPTNLTSTPTCSFNPASIVLGASQTSTLTVATTATTSASAYTVTVTGTSGATVVTTTTTVTVTAPVVPSFTINSSLSNPTIVAGSSVTPTITVTPTNGFTGTVALTCSVTSPGVLTSTPTCSLNPTSVVLGGVQTSTLTVVTTVTTSEATGYSVTVRGTSGATVATGGMTFTVNGAFTLTPTATSFTASAPGQSGNVTINMTATSGFPFSLGLSAGISAGPATSFPPVCSFGASSTVPLTQAAPTIPAVLTCTTTAAGALIKPGTRPTSPRWIVPGSVAAATLAFMLFLLWTPSAGKRRGPVFAGLLMFVAGAVCVGCGGGGTGGNSPNAGTAVGSYTVVVTVNGGGAIQTTSLTFVVQ